MLFPGFLSDKVAIGALIEFEYVVWFSISTFTPIAGSDSSYAVTSALICSREMTFIGLLLASLALSNTGFLKVAFFLAMVAKSEAAVPGFLVLYAAPVALKYRPGTVSLILVFVTLVADEPGMVALFSFQVASICFVC